MAGKRKSRKRHGRPRAAGPPRPAPRGYERSRARDEEARAALEPLAQRLGLGVEAAAAAVLEVAHAQMDRALRLVSVQRGHDLRDCTLIAYGGGGAVHAGPLAASTGIRRVVVPPLAPVFSALGCCLSEVARERVQTRLAPLDEHGLAAARQQLDELVERELATLAGGGERLAEELNVPLLGVVPLDPALRAWGDRGEPLVVAEPESEAAQAILELAETIEGSRRERGVGIVKSLPVLS
jgi:N-methylhydantoinase A/oxoprolinase/acetone carboxylase beta subunit